MSTTCKPALILSLVVLFQLTTPISALVTSVSHTHYANAEWIPPLFSDPNEAPRLIKTEIQTAGHVPFLVAHLECESLRMKKKFVCTFDFIALCSSVWVEYKVKHCSVKNPCYQGHPVFFSVLLNALLVIIFEQRPDLFYSDSAWGF